MFLKNVMVVAVVQLKRCVADAGIFRIIIAKFSYWKKLCPVVLLKVDKSSKVSFYYFDLPLGLTVSLKMKSIRESLLNA